MESYSWLDEDNNGENDLWQSNEIKTTMKLYFDEAVLQQIVRAEDPIAAFNAAWGNEIRIEGVSFTAKFKSFVANIGLWFASLFS